MALKVDIAALEAAAQSVAYEAKSTQAVAAEVPMAESGCGPVDEALGQLIKGWAAQVLALSEVSGGMATSLERSAFRYSSTDHADAGNYEASPSQPGGTNPNPSGSP